MKLAIVNTDSNNVEVVYSDYVPYIGTLIDKFTNSKTLLYVTKIINWPSKQLLRQYGMDRSDITLIVECSHNKNNNSKNSICYLIYCKKEQVYYKTYEIEEEAINEYKKLIMEGVEILEYEFEDEQYNIPLA